MATSDVVLPKNPDFFLLNKLGPPVSTENCNSPPCRLFLFRSSPFLLLTSSSQSSTSRRPPRSGPNQNSIHIHSFTRSFIGRRGYHISVPDADKFKRAYRNRTANIGRFLYMVTLEKSYRAFQTPDHDSYSLCSSCSINSMVIRDLSF